MNEFGLMLKTLAMVDKALEPRPQAVEKVYRDEDDTCRRCEDGPRYREDSPNCLECDRVEAEYDRERKEDR